MTLQVSCNVYYSISGDRFSLQNKDDGTIENAPIILHIYTKESKKHYEFSIPHPIKKGQFFNSECYCTFVNEKDEVLQVGSDTQFQVNMLRDGYDHERLHIKFAAPEYEGTLAWVDSNTLSKTE